LWQEWKLAAGCSPKRRDPLHHRRLPWCLENGIYPKYAIWIKGGGALYSSSRLIVDYYVRLALEREEIMKQSGLPRPAIDCFKCATRASNTISKI